MKYTFLVICTFLGSSVLAQNYSLVRNSSTLNLYEIKDSIAIPRDTLWLVMIDTYCFHHNTLYTTTRFDGSIQLSTFEIKNDAFERTDHVTLDQKLLNKYRINRIVAISYGYYIDKKKGEGYAIPHYNEAYLE